jgi:hypothetical protein
MFLRRSNPTPWKYPSKPTLREHGLPRLIGILDLVQQGQIIDYKTSLLHASCGKGRPSPRDPDQQLRRALPSQHGPQ